MTPDYSMSEPIQPTSETQLSLAACIEALLFVASEAITPGQLSNVLDVSTRKIESALEELQNQYQERGLRIQQHSGRVQLTTAPEAAPLIEHFLGIEATTKLSRAALETLAIVAYQQPVTRPQIESIRGVNSDSVMKSLLSKALIQETGRAEGPGRPFLYGTTPEFLSHFGLSSLKEMPPLNIDELINSKANGENAILKE
jgi:segregation and condensation protein B